MSQAGQPMAEVYDKQEKSPHERAMDRHEAAVAALHEAELRAANIVAHAEREAGEALAEVMRYEKQPGVPLPVDEQRRIEDSRAVLRRRMEEFLGRER